MDNPEKTAGAVKNGQSMETSNIGYTRYKTMTNKTKTPTQFVLNTTLRKQTQIT